MRALRTLWVFCIFELFVGNSHVVAQPAATPSVSAGARIPILERAAIEQKLNTTVPWDLRFRDESGKQVVLGDYFGRRPVVLTLVYYECPMLCTQVLSGLTSTLRAISLDVGRDFDIVTVSFDPDETPVLASAKKQAYIKRYGRPNAAAGWHFLTGTEGSIKRLTDSVGFRYAYDGTQDQFAHGAGIMILTPTGTIARYFYGIEYAPRDLRLGLVEASANKIGTPVDQILLRCFRYDPTTGKYGWAAMNLVRAGFIVTIVALGTFIITALRRDRSQNREPRTENREPRT